ncbi:DUF5333 domain-containing protein [Xinfangfangia sp. CPCC 101601]|uniref:DUF5333 domain-containing protein n=1 Tax=Pseudogemmobacter lacusdianii TaxID=3069608 RepID=A0ABU0VZP7_9RHOB|nr:DUF5333 domain-containing protein [Xinfangfangia sp. CPCC 101601]MDQ2066670.1 DUF5333 domain-containing protein [Xinfangfangia sp. CPCC 101601]
MRPFTLSLKPTLIAVALLGAAPALALEPINKEAHINNILLQGFIADKIADTCPAMEPRKLRALGELNKLRDYALKKGYSSAEVKNFVTSKTEKARGKKEAIAWLAKSGAKEGDAAAHCKIGRAEIAKSSLIGYLLRDKG